MKANGENYKNCICSWGNDVIFSVNLSIYSPQSRRGRRVNFYFSFAAETPANENRHAFGK